MSKVHTILGMHRSGTSWLAGTLQECGLELGQVNEAAPYNPKGTRENADVRELHDAVLADCGGTWRDPPRHPQWSPAREAELRALVERMTSASTRWGFKDPRALLLLDGWHRQVPDGLARVGIFRHPMAVARSLHGRAYDPLPMRHGLRLWRIYNERLVAEHRRDPFPLLRFDGPREGLQAAAEEVAKDWQLLTTSSGPATFFDDELVHNDADTVERVPFSCRRLWSYLSANAVN